MPGDLPTLSGSSNWSSIVPQQGKCYYGAATIKKERSTRGVKAWRKFMTFKMPVHGRFVGRPDCALVYVASAVIPMGWINAVSLFQRLRRQAGLASESSGAGLDPGSEWRRDKPVPRVG